MRGGAYYSTVATMLMAALLDERGMEMVVCCRNGSAMPDLAPDSVVEVNALVNKSGVHPLESGRMPDSIRGLVQHVKAYESLTVMAAAECSYEKAIHALLENPLIHGYKNSVRIVNQLMETFPQYVKLG